MNEKKRKELEENLAFLRQKVQDAGMDVCLPDALHGDVLRYKLEHLDLEEKKPAPVFRWRVLAGMAACFVVVCGSLWMAGKAGWFSMDGEAAQAVPYAVSSAAAAAADMAVPEEAAAEAPAPAVAAVYDAEADSTAQQAEDNANLQEKSLPYSAETTEDGAAVSETVETEEASAPMLMSESTSGSENSDAWMQARSVEVLGDYLPDPAETGLDFVNWDAADGTALTAAYSDAAGSKGLEVTVRTWDEKSDRQRLADGTGEAEDDAGTIIPFDQVDADLLSQLLLQDAGRYSGQVTVLFPKAVVVTYQADGLLPEELYQLILQGNAE